MNRKINRRGRFWVYIVEDKNGAYYTGYTNNLKGRIKRHNNGHGAKYLRGKLPVKLVYSKEYKYYKSALNAERAIKKLGRKKKEELTEKLRLPSMRKKPTQKKERIWQAT